ncbi:MAG: hypothetical protein EON59_03285 [Alphaproteobacteria bacterium]|nr:MAG: hypothetical protein EON59_03285 [Alphaproteobacteria bacterium]
MSDFPRRLPANLPIRPRCQVDPSDLVGWDVREDAAAPVSAHSATAPPQEDADTRYSRTWQEHLPHTGRRPPSKGVGNFRGSIDDGHGHELVFESALEKAAAVIGIAFGKNSRIRSQVGPVRYVDDGDKERHSTFDFAFGTGARNTVAVAVKPARRVVASGIDVTVAAIREQHPGFAGKIDIWTEEQLPRFAEHNADLIRRCRRDRHLDDMGEMKRMLGKVAGSVESGHLVRQSPLGDARAFVALVNLIDDGFIVVPPHQRIGHRAAVRRAA